LLKEASSGFDGRQILLALKGQAQCGALRSILEALGAQRLPAHFPDCGRPSGSPIAGSSSLRRFHPRQPEALLSAALLAETEPGRAGLKPRHAAWRRARPPGKCRTLEKRVASYLRRLQQSPELIHRFFLMPKTQYAAM